MQKRERWGGRFDREDAADPMGAMANLVDVMLVFACGLIAALLVGNVELGPREPAGEPVQKGRELPRLPDGAGERGEGFESVGTVFRDPHTGKLILIGD